MLPRGVIFGLRATIIVMSFGAAGCHTTAGKLPVDSPVYSYRAPDNDDDEDTNDSSDESSAEEAGSGAKKE